MRANEFVNEIEDIGGAGFSISKPQSMLPYATHWGNINGFDIWHYQQEEDHYCILTKNNQVASYAGLVEFQPHKWRESELQTYQPFKGNRLIANLYKFLKTKKISLQSDYQQSSDAFKVWYEHLPALGLDPKILDLHTGKIYDRDAIPKSDLHTKDKELRHKYSMVLEFEDYYPHQNLARSSFSGFRNLWHGEILTEEELTLLSEAEEWRRKNR